MPNGPRTTALLLLCLAASCRALQAPADAAAPPAGTASVVARINGLPVARADFEAALRSGRLGASPELVLDELLSLTLVLHECEVIEGAGACGGGGTVLARADAFLRRLFPPSRACGVVTDDAYAAVFRRLAGRRLPADADPRSPEVRLAVEGEICEARAIKTRRAYVQELRQTAVVEVDRAAVAAASAVPGDR